MSTKTYCDMPNCKKELTRNMVTNPFVTGNEYSRIEVKVIPINESRKDICYDCVIKELEELDLIKNHNHKKGEVKLVSCARCTYEALKNKWEA